MTVTLLGGSWSALDDELTTVLDAADLVVGPKALLAGYTGSARVIETTGPLAESTVDALAAAGSAVVVTTGDPGFFGDLRALRERGVAVLVRPGPTDVQRMAALLRRPWDDITVVSARGRDFRRAVNVCRARPAVAVLTAPGAGPAELAAQLSGWRRQIAVLEDLGGTEELSIVDLEAAGERTWREPNLVLCLAVAESVGLASWVACGEPVPPRGGWALGESAFATRAGVGTSPEVRAVALARLAPRPGSLVWDVCAGSGAIGIEAARLGAAVIAVEADPGLCVRIVANAAAHDVELRLADDEPLDRLPRPDSIFLADARPDLVRACAGAGADRVVVLVAELDRVTDTRRSLAGAGYQVDGCQFSTAALVPGHDSTTLAPAASAFLLWATR
ncbi:bifunctional cobalt-precorrin-7 (C(5))-methyltransferase/cobalt-precorrin-6B (C(15))-methyltransferase [Actinokineospora diospyrosa]|uniref:Precorrin-6Y C5,15-methyltransferase (Decarboxylating) n=1 Tax=Actinokineospora diospyrosa TaxID=103728 RepID=A0ABT1IM85_9PSEU|nr:bifunctional cobalt-precorrin-7 (C(5))-methyltransferase CbiE/decarboxylating cobalt-precorrin-6B (C(15))-methyltransferase CbiT [Actinokineospora diospyrosa]MCP2273758.1 precorrin-6Y C5,15-methyltransferase (decarboxylating) [Actinokineospora diospyrosa]